MPTLLNLDFKFNYMNKYNLCVKNVNLLLIGKDMNNPFIIFDQHRIRIAVPNSIH